MAVNDPLAISQGTNRGEAAFLGESTFDPVEYSYQWAQRRRKEREENKLQQAEDFALLNDKIKTQWDSDTYNYFQPKVEQLKGTIMEALNESKGRLNPLQRMQFKNAWQELSSEADVNNQLWKSYQDQVKNLESDPQGEKWDRDISIKKLQMFRDPYSIPELKADIEQNYGGNINAWRTANYAKYGIEPSFSYDKYIGEITKDEKPQTNAIKDAKGNIIYGRHPTGERYLEEETKLSPQQVSTLNNRIWSENNYRADRAKQRAYQEVDNQFSIHDDGTVTFDSSLTSDQKANAGYVLQQAGDLRGLTRDEIRKQLAKGYTALTIDQKANLGRKTRDIGFAPQGNRSGSGAGFSDKWTTAVVPVSAFGDVRAFNKKYGTSYTAEEFASNQLSPEKIGYIAIEPKSKGADTESIQLNVNGKQVRPVGYKLQGDKVYMTTSELIPIDDGMGKMVYQQKIVSDVPVNTEASANIAAHYGFETFDAFKNMLRKEQKKLGIDSENIQVKKPSAKQGGTKQIKKSDIASKAASAGYSVAEYTKLLKQNGVSIID